MPKCPVCLLWLLLVSAVTPPALAQELAVITLQSRPAHDLLPLVRPLLGADGSIAAQGDRLVVRAPAGQLDPIRSLIAELDRPARNLLIEVRADRHDFARQQRFRLGTPDGETGARGRVFTRERGTRGDPGRQSIRTLEGRAAYIRIGQAVPEYEVSQSRQPGGEIHESYRVRYRKLMRGFYALPRLHGDQVTLEIYQQDERPAFSGRYDIQHASTVVRGGLGEWLPLGATDARASASDSATGYSASTCSREQRYLSVRVTPLD